MFLIYDIAVGIMMTPPLYTDPASEPKPNKRKGYVALSFFIVGLISSFADLYSSGGVNSYNEYPHQIVILQIRLFIYSSLIHCIFNNFLYPHLSDESKERLNLVPCGGSLLYGTYFMMLLYGAYDNECNTTDEICIEDGECFETPGGGHVCPCIDWGYKKPNLSLCAL